MKNITLKSKKDLGRGVYKIEKEEFEIPESFNFNGEKYVLDPIRLEYNSTTSTRTVSAKHYIHSAIHNLPLINYIKQNSNIDKDLT